MCLISCDMWKNDPTQFCSILVLVHLDKNIKSLWNKTSFELDLINYLELIKLC